MDFNTSTLGWKLRSGSLRRRRKHSEQLGKYLAGLLDADGSICFRFNRYKDTSYVYVVTRIVQADTNDPEFKTLIALKDFFGLGSLKFHVNGNNQSNNVSNCCTWQLDNKDSRLLFNRIGKHLRIKGTHFRNLIEVSDSLKGVKVTQDQREELKAFSKCSRKNSKWLKYPKHPSWAWVAGYLDGDGHYDFTSQTTSIQVAASTDDAFILEFLKTAFRGSIYRHKTYNVWRRGLGKSHESFALPFLKKMRMYSCLPHKYNKICKMIKYHQENKQQRLSVNHSKE